MGSMCLMLPSCNFPPSVDDGLCTQRWVFAMLQFQNCAHSLLLCPRARYRDLLVFICMIRKPPWWDLSLINCYFGFLSLSTLQGLNGVAWSWHRIIMVKQECKDEVTDDNNTTDNAEWCVISLLLCSSCFVFCVVYLLRLGSQGSCSCNAFRNRSLSTGSSRTEIRSVRFPLETSTKWWCRSRHCWSVIWLGWKFSPPRRLRHLFCLCRFGCMQF